jgi:hypothetical protein
MKQQVRVQQEVDGHCYQLTAQVEWPKVLKRGDRISFRNSEEPETMWDIVWAHVLPWTIPTKEFKNNI